MSELLKLLYMILLLLAIIVIIVELFMHKASRLSVVKPDKHMLIAGIIEMLGSVLLIILGEKFMGPYAVSETLKYGKVTFTCLFIIGVVNTVRYIADWADESKT